MSKDGFFSPDVSDTPRKRLPRWLILVFIMDTILVAAVLYWVFGREVPSENQSGSESQVGQVVPRQSDELCKSGRLDTASPAFDC